jgi:uncharacterized membrane protein (DUF485 family)
MSRSYTSSPLRFYMAKRKSFTFLRKVCSVVVYVIVVKLLSFHKLISNRPNLLVIINMLSFILMGVTGHNQ